MATALECLRMYKMMNTPVVVSLRHVVFVSLLMTSSVASAGLADLVESGQRAAALEALEKGEDVNAVSVDGTTALHWAVYQADVELISQRIKKGADVSVAHDYGATPL